MNVKKQEIFGDGRIYCHIDENPARRKPPMWRRLLAAIGPGLMVCFADTDGPCLVTAAQSGAEWHYDLLSVQIVLVPILFFAQELTVRLGLIRGMGLVAVLKSDLGKWYAYSVAVPLLFCCALGLISEFSVVGHVMLWWNVPLWASGACFAVGLIGLVFTGSYQVAEKVGLLLGSFQVLLFGTVAYAGPAKDEILDGLASFPLNHSGFVKLVTANIGAVIMPWMLAYQQSAICNKDFDEVDDNLLLGRFDTGLGSVLTQMVMAAMLITVAALSEIGGSVENVDDILEKFVGILGEQAARAWLTVAILGACAVAAIVQSLCAAWVVEDALANVSSASDVEALMNTIPSDQTKPKAERRISFYVAYTLVCCGACCFTLVTDNAVDLSVMTQFINGVLMPPVVFALWYLCAYNLPAQYCLGPFYRWVLFFVFLVVSVFCVGSIFFSFESD
eukprot:TRINITY_DN62232_c0_g1_i1.p1 TRINITY_DN62232_c0_g1~~TRINITY_DN62232_c0_g1_i1.p1  ORF type:complete len:447 (+),score=60.03 TRINITY_DN62232_c0_g1_i1:72-1412(+)